MGSRDSAKPGRATPNRVFDWAFYSQGSRKQGAASADIFIVAGVELLKSLGVLGTEAEFQRLVKDVASRALTLNLLGRFLGHEGLNPDSATWREHR